MVRRVVVAPPALAGMQSASAPPPRRRRPPSGGPAPRVPGPVGLAHLRPRRPAHLQRPHHVDRVLGQTLQEGVDISHRRRRHRHPHRGGRHRVRRFVGRLLLRHRPEDREAALEDQGQITERRPALSGREVTATCTSDGGLITSSAWFQPAAGRPARPRDLRRRLHAVRAERRPPARCTGSTTTPVVPTSPPTPTSTAPASSRPRSSSDGIVLFGVDVDGAPGYRGYLVGASLATGDPVWEYQTDVNAAGTGAQRRVRQRVVVGHGAARPRAGRLRHRRLRFLQRRAPDADRHLALHVTTGRLAWVYRPTLPGRGLRLGLRRHRQCRRRRRQGNASFLGVGGKDGTYYSLDPATGQAAVGDQRRLRWVLGRVHRHHRL